MPVREQARQALLLVERQPAVESIGVAGFEQALLGDSMRRGAGGDLEQGRTTFTHVGPGIVIPVVEQLLALLSSKC
jgi:hypothetical protein